MKYLIPAFLLTLSLSATAQTLTLKVTNPSSIDRKDDPVAVKFREQKSIKSEVTKAYVTGEKGIVPSQLDDLNGDLRYDELFFVTDIPAHTTQTFTITLNADSPEAAEMKKSLEASPRIYTALQLRDKKDLHPDVRRVEAAGSSNVFNDIYMHGMTIESELVGYRIYFDQRQNIDLYGKKLRRIELPLTQFYTSAEQLAQDYGVDVLWAGQAIGCGSFKDSKDGEPQNWTDVAVRGQRVVTTGPLRPIVELYDLGVKKADTGDVFDMYQQYTLVAGHRDVKVDIRFEDRTASKTAKQMIGIADVMIKNGQKTILITRLSKENAEEIGKQFCTGVQKVGVTAEDSVRMGHKSEGMLRKDGVVASWGCDYPDMGKKQLWGPEPIGMAVYVPSANITSQHESELNYTYTVRPNSDNTLHYYLTFCAAKEKDGYHTSQEWFASLDGWKTTVSEPVKMTIK